MNWESTQKKNLLTLRNLAYNWIVCLTGNAHVIRHSGKFIFKSLRTTLDVLWLAPYYAAVKFLIYKQSFTFSPENIRQFGSLPCQPDFIPDTVTIIATRTSEITVGWGCFTLALHFHHTMTFAPYISIIHSSESPYRLLTSS